MQCSMFNLAFNSPIFENYKIAFDKAIKAGVKILCYDCKINDEEVKLNNLVLLICLESKSSNPGSKNGLFAFFNGS